jgi:cytochrome o ubiquinol oxidase subunit 3
MTDRATSYEDLEAEEAGRQRDERAFGFWVYLMSDAVIFALLFATYTVMASATAGGPSPAGLFSLTRTAAETLLLLTSSATFGIAFLTATTGRKRGALAWLGVTALLGLGFLGLEISEFVGMAAQGAGPARNGALSAFFTLVGTHGLHVTMGLVWVVLLGAELAVRGPTDAALSRLFRLGLFWHFLDIVWVGIFSMVYLPGLV